MSCSESLDLSAFFEAPDRIEEIDLDALPDLIGELESMKARLVMRLHGLGQRASGDDPLGNEQLLTMADVAEALGVEQDYAYDLGRRGEIPTVRFGKYVRVRPSDLREFVDNHRQDGLDSLRGRSYKKPKLASHRGDSR